MIVLDSSFLVALHNERDSHHSAALALMNRFMAGEWGRGLLLEYVFLEVSTVLMVRRDIEVAARVGRLLLDAQEVDFVPCSDFFLETLERFAHQDASRLSFADAAIAHVAMQRTGGLVLTFDEALASAPEIRVPAEKRP